MLRKIRSDQNSDRPKTYTLAEKIRNRKRVEVDKRREHVNGRVLMTSMATQEQAVAEPEDFPWGGNK